MTSTVSCSSTSSLVPASFRKPAPKNWEAAFGRLASSYGFGGSSTPSLPPKAFKPSKSPTSSSISSSSSASSRPPSSVTLSEKDCAVLASPCKPSKSSKASVSVVAPSASAKRPQKDYEAAFGSLSSSCGFGGAVPSLPSKRAKSPKISTKVEGASTVSPQSPTSSAARLQKDYESAFGVLSSSYGFGGGVPTLPTRN